jgi:hypothetical protein
MPIIPPVTTAVRPLKSSWFKQSLREAPQIIMAGPASTGLQRVVDFSPGRRPVHIVNPDAWPG